MQEENPKCLCERCTDDLKSNDEDRLRSLEEQLHIYADIVDNIQSQDENPQLPPVIVSKEIALRHMHRDSFNSATKQIGEENTKLVSENELLRRQIEDALYEKENILEEYEEMLKLAQQRETVIEEYRSLIKDELISALVEYRNAIKEKLSSKDENPISPPTVEISDKWMLKWLERLSIGIFHIILYVFAFALYHYLAKFERSPHN